jgi:hypothetical protein
MRGVLGLSVELQTFGSPGGLQVPNFESVGFIPTLGQSGVATYNACCSRLLKKLGNIYEFFELKHVQIEYC